MISWRFYPVVLALHAMRGVQFVTAVGMVSQVGDLSRFKHPRQLMAWLGVTPSEHSSGGKRRQGSITKAGNSYARRLLVEAVWSYCHPARVSPEIQARHEGLPKAIVDRAWDAQVRLCRRFRRLTARTAALTMGLACGPPLYLLRIKFGLHRCQQRPPFRESQTQFRKTKGSAFNDGQNPVVCLD